MLFLKSEPRHLQKGIPKKKEGPNEHESKALEPIKSEPEKPIEPEKDQPNNIHRLTTYLSPNYTILTPAIGDGAFSKVYKGIENQSQKPVAIKVVEKARISSSHLKLIRKEILIMKRLDHPNIVRLISSKENELYIFLILEYCAGGEIFKQLLNLTYLSEDLSRHVIVQVARAVRYLHDEIGVAHRDIKPENLLFIPIAYRARSKEEAIAARRASDGDDKVDEGVFIKDVGGGGIGVVKLADFGLSKVLWNSTTRTPCGTAGYTAPEILRVEAYDKSVDIWALGCVLYTLLCGFPPFYDEKNDYAKLIDKSRKGEYDFLSPWWDEISQEAKDLVGNLLNVDPLKRYTIEQLLNDPWITKVYAPDRSLYDDGGDYFANARAMHLDASNTSYSHDGTLDGLTTPSRVDPKSPAAGELLAKELKYRSVILQNMEVGREVASHVPVIKEEAADLLEALDGVSFQRGIKIDESAKKEKGSGKTTKRNSLPRTPCPSKLAFDGVEEGTEESENTAKEEDSFDSESEKSEANSKSFMNLCALEENMGRMKLCMDGSAVLQRRKQKSL